ncbi:MAG: hypothetical protein H7Z42_17230 [Roseiflexaceae bacterium]|nr:hypothetical protein [Roseiflexaceae bacterium]
MDSLFLALGLLVFVLLALLLWFVPHLLQQQAVRVASETSQLREMLLDLLNEQEAVTLRQSQLGGSLSTLRDHLEVLVKEGVTTSGPQQAGELQRVEQRIGEVQRQIQEWMSQRDSAASRQSVQDNESWGYLLSLLAAIQERMGRVATERADLHVSTRATDMLREVEHEMQHLRDISEDIERLQWRMRQSLHEREGSVTHLRAQANGA